MTEGTPRPERPIRVGKPTDQIDVNPPADLDQAESNSSDSSAHGTPLPDEQIEAETFQAENKVAPTPKTGGSEPRRVRKKRSKLGSGRGVETMFRTSYRVHIDLTRLADNKANIMISINGMMITVMLFALIPLLEYSQLMIVPSSTLVLTCLVSIVYAVLSARPRINANPVTRTSILANRSNILFFGNFSHLTESEFVDGMSSMMGEVDNIYYSMMRDIYGIGKVLSKKFALLKVAYTVFMMGLIVSILLYIGSFILIAMEDADRL